MKIALVLSNPRIVASDGVVSQANTWKQGLESLGNEVVLVNMWEVYEWNSFHVILVFGFNAYLKDFITWVFPINPNIVVAPIIDPNYSLWGLWCYARWGNCKLRLSNSYHDLFSIRNKVKMFLVRSTYERLFLSKGFGINPNKCRIVPLSYSLDEDIIMFQECKREPFCLHISLLCDSRKNVKRLIEASTKYGFKLVLCGKLRSNKEKKLLERWIENAPNVEYKGFVSSTEMIDLYKKASVFALPSTYEGVGIVALDAAAMGCDVVITKLGGPKEYYSGMALEVNPYSVDDIGKAVVKILEGKTFQPKLKEYICENNSLHQISKLLIEEFEKIR